MQQRAVRVCEGANYKQLIPIMESLKCSCGLKSWERVSFGGWMDGGGAAGASQLTFRHYLGRIVSRVNVDGPKNLISRFCGGGAVVLKSIKGK